MTRHPLRSALLLTLGLSACFGDDDGPGSHEVATTTRLIQYSACSELEADMNDVLIREVEAYIDQIGVGWGRGGASEGDSAPARWTSTRPTRKPFRRDRKWTCCPASSRPAMPP